MKNPIPLGRNPLNLDVCGMVWDMEAVGLRVGGF